jgi:hypothetical protein
MNDAVPFATDALSLAPIFEGKSINFYKYLHISGKAML